MRVVDRIDELLKERKITGLRLCKEVGISPSILSQWRHKGRNPSINNLRKIADYFDVSADYLLLRDDELPAPLAGVALPPMRNITLEEADIPTLGEFIKIVSNGPSVRLDGGDAGACVIMGEAEYCLLMGALGAVYASDDPVKTIAEVKRMIGEGLIEKLAEVAGREAT